MTESTKSTAPAESGAPEQKYEASEKHGSDICKCGDYRSQHVDSIGKCRVCDPHKNPWDGCNQFTFLHRANAFEWEHWHLHNSSESVLDKAIKEVESWQPWKRSIDYEGKR